MSVTIKRVYEPPSAADGARVLVDRLWPRGLTKAKARIHVWLKELAPSHELRRWFHERPEYFQVFRKRYLKEMADPTALQALEQLYKMAGKEKIVTLVYASHDEAHNNAVVLRDLLHGMRKPPSSSGPARAAAARNRARMPRS
ncbi:MAG TPA: DUF488 family protein [Terriglobales bacterium]|jgi:uncharacterized protein YeaO (DUF488 family)|nr:DUF488 family protein [Terriglobales bacterium]